MVTRVRGTYGRGFRVKSDTIENVNKTGWLCDHKAGFCCNRGESKTLSSIIFDYF